jgi:uncharacterized protein YoxC
MFGTSVKRFRTSRIPVKTLTKLNVRSSALTPPETHSARGRGFVERAVNMESNRTVQVNWGTFNVPTLLSVLGILWYTATHTERQDNQLDSNKITMESLQKSLDDLRTKTAPLDNVIYRLTTLETKVDRTADALQDIRTSVGALSTSFEVLSQKIDNVLPQRKSEILIPPEYARKN